MPKNQIVYQNKNKSEQQLNELEDKTDKPLMHISAVFPFDFFPNSISVDKKKIDIVYRDFFATKHTFTILNGDLRTVSISHGLFFACLIFEVAGFEKNPEQVCYLKRQEAETFRDLVMGLYASETEKINIHGISNNKAKQKLTKVGAIKSKE